MSGEAVKIAIRVRPFINEPNQTCCIKMTDVKVSVMDTAT